MFIAQHASRFRMLEIILAIYGIGIGISQSLMSLGSILLVVLLLISIVQQFKSLSKNTLFENLAILFTIMYVLWTFAIWLLGDGLKNSSTQSLELFPLLIIPLISVLPHVSKEKCIRFSKIFFTALFVSLIISSLYSIYQAIIENRMAIGFLNNPIYLAYNLLFSLVGLSLILKSFSSSLNKFQSFTILTTLLLVYFALVATNSRMALVVATLTIVIIVVPWAWRSGYRRILIMTCLLLVGFVSSEYIRKPYVQKRLAAIVNLNDPSWKGRIKAWNYNISIIEEHPWTGVGPKQNALKTKTLSNKWKKLWGEDVAIFAHNVYLQVLAESGIIGMILLCTSFLFYGISRPLCWPLILALAIGGLTENILSNSKPYHSFLFWMLLMGIFSPRPSRAKQSM